MLAIGAHHDDIEIGAGGTIAKYIQKGWRVIYAIATSTPHYEPNRQMWNEKNFLSNAEAIEWRQREAREGAKILGIAEEDIHFWNFKSQYWYLEGTHNHRYFNGFEQSPDEFTELNEHVPGREFITYAHNCQTSQEFLIDFMEENEVEVVLTQLPDDPQLEHYAVASFTSHAVMSLVKLGEKIDLYAWSEGDARHMLNSFAPTHFEDITKTIDIKCKSLEVFKSQFKDRNPQFFLDASRNRAQFYGKICGMEYAEAFMKFNTHPHDSFKVRLANTYNPERARKSLGN
jgi:LmbE family N-acetylglucosaminyl deacetylase